MKKFFALLSSLLIATLLYSSVIAESTVDSLKGTWFFTSYEYLKYVSTPDRQKLHVQADIEDDLIVLKIDRDDSHQVIETSWFLNDGGVAFSIENDASYLLRMDESGRLYLFGADEENLFPGFKYWFDREPAKPDPEIGSNPDFWWEGDWVIYNVYDRDQMKNERVNGRISFGAYLDTDVNYAEICFPDGTLTEYTYDFLPDLMLLNDNGHISVTRRDNGSCVFSFGGADYSFARTAPEEKTNEIFVDRNVLLCDVDTGELITYGDPFRVSLSNPPEALPEDVIPKTLEYGSASYYFDETVCTADYNPDRHGYVVFMKLKPEEAVEEPEVPVSDYIPVNPWIYTGDNFESILLQLIAQRSWGPAYTFNPEDNSFTVDDGTGTVMSGHFIEEGDGAYSMAVLMGGIERVIYADDFHSYETSWDKLTLDPEHEYLDALIQAMIRKEEKESWWIELDDDGTSGTAEDSNDNEIPFTYEFFLSDEGETCVRLTYNEKTIDNYTLRK